MTNKLQIARLAADIREDLAAIDHNNADSLSHAIHAGTKLNEAKALLAHGEWLPWLEQNFTLSERTAQEYMRLAANPQRSADFDSIASALAALKAEKPARKQSTRKPPQEDESALKGKIGLSHDPEVVDWVEARFRDGWDREQIVKASKNNTDGWPRSDKSLTNGGVSECRAAIAAKERAKGDAPREPKQQKKEPKWSGKRLRELHADKRAGKNGEFNNLQMAIAKAVSVLEMFELPDLDWEDPMNTELAGFVFEDLTELERWTKNAMGIAAVHMGDMEKQKLIRKLRARAESTTFPGERDNCFAAIERLTNSKRLKKGA